MPSTLSSQLCRTSARSAARAAWLCGLLLLATSGCAALHPLRGVPAAYLPDPYLGPSRDDKRPIDPSLLVRSAPDQHRVGPGDVLSIFIPNVLGSQSVTLDQNVGINPPINLPLTPADPPTVGYPIQVRDDGTIALPWIAPLNVTGMTLHEVEQSLRGAYLDTKRILNPDDALILVSLFRPRVHRVLVVRQEPAAGISFSSGPGSVNIGDSGKGMAREVILRAYENDVMHALSKAEGGADGLPGLSAENAVYIIRRPRCFFEPGAAIQPQPVAPFQNGLPQPQWPQLGNSPPISPNGIQTVGYEQNTPLGGYRGNVNFAGHSLAMPETAAGGGQVAGASGQWIAPAPAGQLSPAAGPVMSAPVGHSLGIAPVPVSGAPVVANPTPQWSAMLADFDPTIDNPNVIRIPIRLGPGEVPQICEEDITLYDGDIVFIESRATEVFYTGGLIGGGQYTLPRDYDLRVLEAISIAEGKSNGGNNLNRAMGGVSALNQDVANSASRLAILRTLPNGQRITIEVNLIKAMRYQEENIIVQPGDMLILEYTCPEAVAAFTQRFLFEGALIGVAASMFTGGSN